MIGEVLDSYRIVRKLGEGGMGVVYYAEHTSIGTRAAVKVLMPELSANADIVTRFFNEARAATLIEHPGIVQVFHFGQAVLHLDGHEPSKCAYFIMEFLSGESLGSKIRRQGYFDPELVVAITSQAADALAAAHDKGIVHRDLKPDNVFLVPDRRMSCGEQVKILDFGIAKLASETTGIRTKSNMMMGTPAYMSPEQCRGAGSVDHRSDIYSLGCIVYEMAVGQRPFGNISAPGELVSMHQHHEPPPPRTLVPGIRPPLEAVILRMLAKRLPDRYQSMRAVIEDMERVARGQAPALASMRVASPPTVPERPAPGGTLSLGPANPTTLGSAASQSVAEPAPRRRVYLGAGVVVAAAAAVVAVVLIQGWKHDPRRDAPLSTEAPPMTQSALGGATSPLPAQPVEAPPAAPAAPDAGVAAAPKAALDVAPSAVASPAKSRKEDRKHGRKPAGSTSKPTSSDRDDEEDEDKIELPK